MPYAVLADLVSAFGEEELILLTDRVNVPPTAVDEAVAGRALDTANATVDSYLSVRYALPLANTADTQAALTVLRGLVCDIARYMLTTVAPDDDVKQKYDAAMSRLRDFQRGVAVLPGVSTGQPASANMVEIVSGQKVFSRDARR